MRQRIYTLSGAPSTPSDLDNLHLSILDYYILSIYHYLESRLSYCTWIFDLTRNISLQCMHIYHVYGLTRSRKLPPTFSSRSIRPNQMLSLWDSMRSPSWNIFAAKAFVHTTKPWQTVCEKLVLIVALCQHYHQCITNHNV